jgi:hypothetical protein
MNAIFPTVLKRLYRKEPISSFIIMVGAVDAILGGVNEIGTLMILGFLTSGVAIGYRWWCIQQAESKYDQKSKQLYLPSQSERSPLPNFDNRRKPTL